MPPRIKEQWRRSYRGPGVRASLGPTLAPGGSLLRIETLPGRCKARLIAYLTFSRVEHARRFARWLLEATEELAEEQRTRQGERP